MDSLTVQRSTKLMLSICLRSGSRFVESKRERMKKLNCLSIPENKNTRFIFTEKTILGEAEYDNRVQSLLPVPTLGLLLSMGAGEVVGAGEVGGGRQGQWGPSATSLMPEPASTKH